MEILMGVFGLIYTCDAFMRIPVPRSSFRSAPLLSSNEDEDIIPEVPARLNNADPMDGALTSFINADFDITRNFVPIFVGVWAVGYSLLAFFETTTSGGLGDLGGTLGVGFVIFLALALMAVLLIEVFKEEE